MRRQQRRNTIVWHVAITDKELEILEEEWGGYFEVIE